MSGSTNTGGANAISVSNGAADSFSAISSSDFAVFLRVQQGMNRQNAMFENQQQERNAFTRSLSESTKNLSIQLEHHQDKIFVLGQSLRKLVKLINQLDERL
jgi:hypothetical protein